MSHRIIPAILSGGAGTRLWPLSTEARPKQFHTLGGAETLFAATAKRVTSTPFAPPIVLCNGAHLEQARAGLREAGVAGATFVLEPAARNTAAAAAIAAAIAAEREPDALVLLLPSDHIVSDVAAFHAALARAAPFARERIVAFGITPDRPATGYGYIKSGAPLGEGVFAIEAFREKPDEPTARAYLADGGYSWNAGMFLFEPNKLLNEFGASAEIRDGALAALDAARRAGDEIWLDAETFARVPSQPLDIAVMEKTNRGAVAPCDFGWADIGSWDEVWRRAPRDADGYAILGAAAAADVSRVKASGISGIAVDGDHLIIVAAPRGIIILPRALAAHRASLDRLAQSL